MFPVRVVVIFLPKYFPQELQTRQQNEIQGPIQPSLQFNAEALSLWACQHADVSISLKAPLWLLHSRTERLPRLHTVNSSFGLYFFFIHALTSKQNYIRHTVMCSSELTSVIGVEIKN